MSQQPSGWYDDPSNPEMLRYWDGVMWSSQPLPRSRRPCRSTGLPPQAGSDVTGAAATQGVPTPTTPMPQGSGWQGQAPRPTARPTRRVRSASLGSTARPAVSRCSGERRVDAVDQDDGRRRAAGLVGATLGAWIIDGILLTILSYLLLRAFAPDYFTTVENLVDAASRQDQEEIQALATDIGAQSLRVGLITWGAVTVYCLAFWTTLAQTPGKMALGISVRRADRPGPLDIATAVRRRVLSALQIVPFISGLYFIVFLLDYLWPLWDDKRQALHDKVAATQVVVGKQPRNQR